MKPHEALLSLAVLLLSLSIELAAGQTADTTPANKSFRDDASDAEISEAFGAVARADGYKELLVAIEQNEAVIGSRRLVALADQQLQDSSLDINERGLLILERQLSLDCRQRGAQRAAQLLAVRLIAGYAIKADSPQQFAGTLEKFSPLEAEMDEQLVRDALDTPGNTWPKALLPLMEQLAREWPEDGALAAATHMAEAANGSSTQNVSPDGGEGLVGHWLYTSIVFESARDENLALRPDGTAEAWIATASGAEPPTSGRWRTEGTALIVEWDDGTQWSQPFTFHEGQLIFPNIPGRRKNWERIN